MRSGKRTFSAACGAPGEGAQDDLQAQRDAGHRRGALVSVIAEVARNYIDLRTAQQREIVAGANIQIQSETLDVAKQLKGVGIVSDLDVTPAEPLRWRRRVRPALRCFIRSVTSVLYGFPVVIPLSCDAPF